MSQPGGRARVVLMLLAAFVGAGAGVGVGLPLAGWTGAAVGAPAFAALATLAAHFLLE
jgi:hypothetical protein